MFEKHPQFETPPDDTVIWRFMDLTKFLAMLAHRSLFFCQANKLEDPYEGTWPKAYITGIMESMKKTFEHAKAKNDQEKAEIFMKFITDTSQMFLPLAYVNCWHMNPFESAAMWKLHTTNEEGIAIQSTVKRLCESMRPAKAPIWLGKVNYIDFDQCEEIRENIFLYKRRSFEHERELRAVMDLFKLFPEGPYVEGENWEEMTGRFRSFFNGYLPVDLDVLIEKVLIAPKSAPWHKDLIQAVLDKFGVNKPLHQSTLYDKNLH